MTIQHEAPTAEVLDLIASVNQHEVEAVKHEDKSSNIRYEQARDVKQLQTKGRTHQWIADNWVKPDGTNYTRRHVSYVVKTWQTFGNLSSQERLPWNAAYNSDEVRKKKKDENDAENEGIELPDSGVCPTCMQILPPGMYVTPEGILIRIGER